MAFTCAPHFINKLMIVRLPLWAAADIGATPFRLWWLGSTPHRSNTSTASTFWILMQWVSTLSLSWKYIRRVSLCKFSPPFSKSRSEIKIGTSTRFLHRQRYGSKNPLWLYNGMDWLKTQSGPLEVVLNWSCCTQEKIEKHCSSNIHTINP